MTKEHLTEEDRAEIYLCLNRNDSLKSIGKLLGKCPTTISREIRRSIEVIRKGHIGRAFNDCLMRTSCKAVDCCDKLDCKRNSCANCREACCSDSCKLYTPARCQRLEKAPYVCNGCEKRNSCLYEQHYYQPIRAQKRYRNILSESRAGVCITENEADVIGNLLKKGLGNGQSIYHILQAAGGENIGYCAKTIYSYINDGIFPGVANIDLPRKVRYSKRKKNEARSIRVDKQCAIGRSYADFLAFKESNPDVPVVQMDTVEGKKGIGEKVLLTLHFTSSRLMLAILLDSKSSACVTAAFQELRDALGSTLFAKLFQVILTDNGSEFSDPAKIEIDSRTGTKTTSVYYCEPRQSQQKGACEVNHEFIRRIIPKYTSMNPYSQQDIDTMMSHINSYLRAELAGKCPLQLFSFLYGEEMPYMLGLRYIEPGNIVLKPCLISK